MAGKKSEAMVPIRVLIVDDHPLFRDGVRALLNSISEAEVVGEAATGEEAIAQAVALHPDVILRIWRVASIPFRSGI